MSRAYAQNVIRCSEGGYTYQVTYQVRSHLASIQYAGPRSRNTTSRVSEHQLFMKNPILVDFIFCGPFLKTFIDEAWNM